MPWPIPTPDTVTARAAAVYQGIFPDFDASAENTVAGTTAAVVGMSAQDLYVHQVYVAGELFPDTTLDNVDHHASVWGLTRIPASASSGPATGAGANGTAIPLGTTATDPTGNAYTVTVAGTVSAGAATVTVASVTAGAQGNLAAGTVLTLLSPIAGLSPQSLTVASPGLSGGAAAESDAALTARTLARIRRRGRGGDNDDYRQWAFAASASVAYVQPVPNWIGPGSVAVFVAGAGPSALTTDEVAGVDAYMQGVRPITAHLYTLAATVQTVNATIHLIPDTAANRLAAAAAFESWVVLSADIGATLFLDGLDSAIKGALGVGDFDLITPAADLAFAAGVIASPGTLGFA